MSKPIQPIESFDTPEEAYGYYLTMVKYFQSRQAAGLLDKVIWEVTMSSGSIHPKCSVYVNIIKSNSINLN
jgi:hypothetical protein